MSVNSESHGKKGGVSLINRLNLVAACQVASALLNPRQAAMQLASIPPSTTAVHLGVGVADQKGTGSRVCRVLVTWTHADASIPLSFK